MLEIKNSVVKFVHKDLHYNVIAYIYLKIVQLTQIKFSSYKSKFFTNQALLFHSLKMGITLDDSHSNRHAFGESNDDF